MCKLKGKKTADRLQQSLESLTPTPDATTSIEVDEESHLWEVGAYFHQYPDTVGLALLSEAFAVNEFTVSIVADEDWVAKVNRELPPIRSGRFVVFGKHTNPDLKSSEFPLLIEASLAFGTGHHATSQMCLEMIDHHHQQGFEVSLAADIGCGTGLLAIAIATLWECRVDCGDVDPTAIEICQYNAETNGKSKWINAQLFKGAPSDRLEPENYDLVVANILSEPLIEHAAELAGLLAVEGKIIISGILINQLSDVMAVYEKEGLTQIGQEQKENWVSLSFIKKI